MKVYRTLTLLLFIIGRVAAEECCDYDPTGDLERDLAIVNRITHKMNSRLPVTYNASLQGGYFLMPSARMGNSGELSFGLSLVPPYRNYNVRCQFMSNLELTGNYHIFTGVDDPILSPHGFGDFSDKGANAKIALWHPEDTDYKIPGIAFGFDDFLGTQAFQSQYVVLTQVIPSYQLEFSFGWGMGRMRGPYGGILWMPWQGCSDSVFQGVAFGAEYDCIRYKDPECEHHPRGREQSLKINYGIKYRLGDYFDFFVSQVRGKKVAIGASAWYNFGETLGFIPKIDDAPIYTTPVVQEPFGPYRPVDAFTQELAFALDEQGFELFDAWIYYDSCQRKVLRFSFENDTYPLECEVRERITELLAHLLPSDIDMVLAVTEEGGLPIQEYRFFGQHLRDYENYQIGNYEMLLLSPLREVSCLDNCAPYRIFHKNQPAFNIECLPRTHTYFGSSRGKFKYAVGITVETNGYLTPASIFYKARFSYLFFSDLEDCSSIDMLNPSQMINVQTDIVNYDKQRGVMFDQLYLQKNWNMGCGFYSRFTVGYLDSMYGGAGAEILYYPVNSPFAVGLEGALVKKRQYKGLGFTNTIRILHGYTPSYVYFLGSQYFANFYYDWKDCSLLFETNAGKFLGNDYGARFEVARYFSSGLQLFFWYTRTNARDQINGSTYYDKGVGFSMPLDIFYTHSSISRFGYALSAWLRDCGYRTFDGELLYESIYLERQ